MQVNPSGIGQECPRTAKYRCSKFIGLGRKLMGAVTETPKAIALPQRRGRFTANLVANVGYLGLSMLVGVWYVPFLVKHLGAAAYGLIPLASTLTSYMSLITLGLNAAVGRSLTIALEQGDDERANRIFNTSLWG